MSEDVQEVEVGNEPEVKEVEPTADAALTSDDKLWGMLSHLLVFCSLVGVPFGNIIAPLVIMLVQKDKSEYVVEQAKESLNFQIAYTAYGFGITILCFLLIGLLLIIPFVIVWIVFPIIAGMKAREGVKYEYPYIFRLVK